MPTLDDVYLKFGAVSEAAQLLETQLGNIVLVSRGSDLGLFQRSDPKAARDLLDHINRSTLGQLLQRGRALSEDIEGEIELLSAALAERNRLSHTFFREHNFRRNSADGCALMLKDLESIHDVLIDAFKLVLRISGVDIDAVTMTQLPTDHLKLD